MSAIEKDLAAAVDAAVTGDDRSKVHVICCRPTRALCGATLHGDYMPPSSQLDCIRCEVILYADTPCGARFCRLRSAWRLLMGRS